MKNLSKEDQERIAAEAQAKGLVSENVFYCGGFVDGANYEHPIAYNKGLEDGAGYFNKESFNEAIEEVRLRMIARGCDPKDYNGAIFFEEIDKLKR